jgi:hypothetical protein
MAAGKNVAIIIWTLAELVLKSRIRNGRGEVLLIDVCSQRRDATCLPAFR